MTNPIDLPAIEARCNAAMQEQWRPFTIIKSEDHAFYTRAKDDLLVLIDRVRELEAENAELRGTIKEWEEYEVRR